MSLDPNDIFTAAPSFDLFPTSSIGDAPASNIISDFDIFASQAELNNLSPENATAFLKNNPGVALTPPTWNIPFAGAEAGLSASIFTPLETNLSNFVSNLAPDSWDGPNSSPYSATTQPFQPVTTPNRLNGATPPSGPAKASTGQLDFTKLVSAFIPQPQPQQKNYSGLLLIGGAVLLVVLIARR